ncbi:MAG: hypothetical protein ACRELV_14830 [Longimicrobiales bacterium]
MTRYPGRLLAFSFTLASLLPPAPAHAQSVRDALNALFVFSGGETPLFLGGSAGVPATQVHGDHFLPSESQANGAVIRFMNESIATNVANFPLGSTVSSQTFVFVGGVPTPTSNSFGPIFAERAPTVGRGRFNAGMSYSRLSFDEIRGTPLSSVLLTFLHQNVDFPGCDEVFGGDCTDFGEPLVEHDMIELELDLDMQAEIYAFHASIGLTDWLDLALAVPVIHFRLDGRSEARILPLAGQPVVHFFGGTPEDPVLEASSRSSGESTGIGDIATRIKARLTRNEGIDVALLGEVRAPTGSEEEFLGSGELSARGLIIASGAFGAFSPHVNAGYIYRGGELDQDAIELAAGFDHGLAPWATLAVDLLGSFKLGEPPVAFPAPVTLQSPHEREIRLTNIPDRNDDIVDGAVGFKFRTPAGIVLVANALIPLNEGGLRSGVVPTFGIEYSH